MALNLSTHVADDHVVVKVRGELDQLSAPQLHDRLLTIPAQHSIVLDLSALESITAAAVRTLLAFQLRASQLGRTLALACAGPAVLSMLEKTALDEYFAIYPTVDQAVHGAGQTPITPAGNPGTAGIIDLIAADRARIYILGENLRDIARRDHGMDIVQALNVRWTELAWSMEAHLSAMDEICLLPMLGTDSRALQRRRTVTTQHDDIREVLREAARQPSGSPTWWRLVNDALSRWAQLIQGQQVVTDFARRADKDLRERLGREWLAFLTAWHADRYPFPTDVM
jgi:anti-sigma B factor antagonist